MATRLDRLVLLLETGSTAAVRATAAQQLGDIQKQHPSELFNLLSRVMFISSGYSIQEHTVIVHLRSKNWDTRIAAGQAIEAIVSNVPQWDPNAEDSGIKQEIKTEPDDITKPPTSAPDTTAATQDKFERLSFGHFDISQVLQNGKLLLGSAGKEYDLDLSDLDPAERLALQRKNLAVNLGITSQFMDVDLVDEKDLGTAPALKSTLKQPPTSGVAAPHGSSPPLASPGLPPGADLEGLSARERNKLKRRAKTDLKFKGKDKVRVIDLANRRGGPETPGTPGTPGTASGAGKQGEGYFDFTPQSDGNKVVVEAKLPVQSILETSTEWPFEGVCDLLCMDLFDPNWEVRHGAGIGLREIIKVQGRGAGRMIGCSQAENDSRHHDWLEDVAIRVLCVFALDRFGDFVSDQVVAPVRETCSQTLGALMRHMSDDSVRNTLSVLMRLIYQSDVFEDSMDRDYIWEVRHAGMLGLKYAVAVRRDLLETGTQEANVMLEAVVQAVVLGLQDEDDDVRSVSASTLIPIASNFVEALPAKIPEVVNVLWDCLAVLKDDLSASTASVMDLLAKLFTFQSVLDYMVKSADESHSLVKLIPRLNPFFRHTIASVRLAVLNALLTFLNINTIAQWVDDCVIRMVYQNLIVEEKKDILQLSLKVFKALIDHLAKTNDNGEALVQVVGPHLSTLFTILLTPIGTPLDPRLFYSPSGQVNVATTAPPPTTARGRRAQAAQQQSHNVDAAMMKQELSLVSHETVVRCRVAASTGLGFLLMGWPQDQLDTSFMDLLQPNLTSPWAMRRQMSSIVVAEWAQAFYTSKGVYPTQEGFPFAINLSAQLINVLVSDPPLSYLESITVLKGIRGEMQALWNSFVSDGKLPSNALPPLPQVSGMDGGVDGTGFTVDYARQFAQVGFTPLLNQIPNRARKTALAILNSRMERVIASIGYFEAIKEKADLYVAAAVGSAVINLGTLPPKLNPVINSVMKSVRSEENLELQTRSAVTLTNLVILCNSPFCQLRVVPTPKLVSNLGRYLCGDTSVTPSLDQDSSIEGIYSLKRVKDTSDEKVSVSTSGAKSASNGHGLDDVKISVKDTKEPVEDEEAKLTRRGALCAFKEFAQRFGADLFKVIPRIWEGMSNPLLSAFANGPVTETTALQPDDWHDIIDALELIKTLVPHLHADLHRSLGELMPMIATALLSPFTVVRHAAAKCLATVCNVMTVPGMCLVIERVVPYLGDTANVIRRQGAVEMINEVVQMMDAKILPYVVFLIVPILGRMSDPDEPTRLVATNCFAYLIKLVPLEAGIPNPPEMPEEMLQQRGEERQFLMQLLDSKKLQPYHIPIKIKAELRKYQQEGVNWLAFLNKYQLHGILCDDMGLGKTLQSICMLASNQHDRQTKFAETGFPQYSHCPSLVVCPPTLTGHWYHEILQYTDNLKPIMYTGGPADRKRLRSQIPKNDVVIMSYDVVRNDIEDLSKIQWNYCILDEGHIIKNGRTKITKAVKMIRANNRVILSGTPIQNNVLELWSLFDFLMPGFLGTEKQFNERFGKPILASRDCKSSSREQEAGVLALETLHKQVLPFLLRRLKEDVLSDLPPKIIQDYYCELSDLQKQLYEEFARSQIKREVEDDLLNDDTKVDQAPQKATHIFQALQYLRKLCNHPLLVVNENHPEYRKVMAQLKQANQSLHDLQFAPKLQALKQLLVDCGIGAKGSIENEADTISAGAVSQHRALIFCQQKAMLDIIENDLLKPGMPTVSYMRLDGGVDASRRHGIVQKFNADPSIDLLLLTTHVGGLGLNLTGADTVIFVEHDWNPMKDLQAMDRAHRLGQKKVVNVYRLISRGTLEEKIMGLQKFKLNIANTVINQQNSGLQSMGTDQILDLFQISDDGDGGGKRGGKKGSSSSGSKAIGDGGGAPEEEQDGKASTKNVLESLEGLWDERQYEEEYNIDSFISSLK
ncbi:TATA-binding protein-associated factor mot1 [Actinomortierella ambigua]|uniref:TATA-binding protein-associated factor mot1 n=1 Tax=Actinomortierella ambigua TaxID=1343610 RepID=A0A9P6PPH4_9FUNG|nr:TATA-binding protein-associated factor mot1 [Actinomortierella ambigua]